MHVYRRGDTIVLETPDEDFGFPIAAAAGAGDWLTRCVTSAAKPSGAEYSLTDVDGKPLLIRISGYHLILESPNCPTLSMPISEAHQLAVALSGRSD